MKIATYNIWNSQNGMPERENQIIDEINSLDSDVIVLQEVRNRTFNEKLLKYTDYKNYCFAPHNDEEEGLAVYSKYPIMYSKYIDYALIVIVEHMNNLILFVNVHLPWDSIIEKEKCIVNVIKEISTISSDYRFILGDFNCSETSSIHQYLSGNRSLKETEAKPYWTDLAMVAEESLGIKKEMTLDLINNPRWKGKSTTDISSRVDCIFIHDCFPKPNPALRTLRYFGKEVNEKSHMCASDHYGVFVNLQMPYD